MTVKTYDLNSVRVARENPRTSRSGAVVSKMAASLLALGLLHSLVGYEENGTAHITAGGTRVLAIKQLLKNGDITAEHELVTGIAVNVREKSQAIDTGLTSNLVQSIMSQPDQFRAYSNLHHDEGVSIEDIAERYFTDAAQVRRILKLANLAAPIFKAFNAEKITIQIAKVYAGCSDQDKQLRAWKECGVSGHASQIRNILREASYKSTAQTVQWITQKSYEEAGGRIELDLFDDETLLIDGTIVDELFAQKCTDFAEGLEADGWGQVTYFEDWSALYDVAATLNNQLKPAWKPNKRDKAAYAKQEGIIDTVTENHGTYEWQWADRVKKQVAKAKAKMETIEERANVYSDNQKKGGHVLWTFGRDGVDVRYMSAKLKPSAKAKAKAGADADAPKVLADFSNSFTEQVQRTAGNALMCHLTQNPSKLCRVLAIMAITGDLSGVDISGREIRAMKYAHDIEMSELESRAPLSAFNTKERIAHLMAMSEAELDAEMAYALLPRYEIGSAWGEQLATFQLIAKESEFDLSSVWTMDEEELSALSKKQLLRVVESLGRNADSFEKCKKSELVIVAARYVAEQKWTPEFIRTHEPTPIAGPIAGMTVKAETEGQDADAAFNAEADKVLSDADAEDTDQSPEAVAS